MLKQLQQIKIKFIDQKHKDENAYYASKTLTTYDKVYKNNIQCDNKIYFSINDGIKTKYVEIQSNAFNFLFFDNSTKNPRSIRLFINCRFVFEGSQNIM